MEALVLTAVDVYAQRKGTEPSKTAEDWLTWVNEEKLLLLAMMSDAGDELLQLIRFLDTESHDTARVCVSIQHFLNTCSALFVDREVLGLPGYTRHAMEVLQQPMAFKLGKDARKTIGGPGSIHPATLGNAFQRLNKWLHTATSV
eukprot:3137440-Alexandrium_andersonii.AAC.1